MHPRAAAKQAAARRADQTKKRPATAEVNTETGRSKTVDPVKKRRTRSRRSTPTRTPSPPPQRTTTTVNVRVTPPREKDADGARDTAIGVEVAVDGVFPTGIQLDLNVSLSLNDPSMSPLGDDSADFSRIDPELLAAAKEIGLFDGRVEDDLDGPKIPKKPTAAAVAPAVAPAIIPAVAPAITPAAVSDYTLDEIFGRSLTDSPTTSPVSSPADPAERPFLFDGMKNPASSPTQFMKPVSSSGREYGRPPLLRLTPSAASAATGPPTVFSMINPRPPVPSLSRPIAAETSTPPVEGDTPSPPVGQITLGQMWETLEKQPGLPSEFAVFTALTRPYRQWQAVIKEAAKIARELNQKESATHRELTPVSQNYAQRVAEVEEARRVRDRLQEELVVVPVNRDHFTGAADVVTDAADASAVESLKQQLADADRQLEQRLTEWKAADLENTAARSRHSTALAEIAADRAELKAGVDSYQQRWLDRLVEIKKAYLLVTAIV